MRASAVLPWDAVNPADSVFAIARQTGLSVRDAVLRLRAAGFAPVYPAPTTKRIPDPAALARIIASYQAGHSLRPLAAEAGVAVNTLRRWLREAGVPMHRRGRPAHHS